MYRKNFLLGKWFLNKKNNKSFFYEIISNPNCFLKITSVLIFIIILSGCSSTKQIQSRWNSENINIDGEYEDWKDKLTFFEDEKVFVGIQNNDKFLYLCLIMEEPYQALQILRRGFIVWFIPENDSEIFGLKFPLGINYKGEQDFEFSLRRDMTPGDILSDKKLNLEKVLNEHLEKEKNFQIIDESKYSLWMYSLENEKELKIKMAVKSNKLVYELKIPIAKRNKEEFTLPVSAGNKLKITFKTEEIKLRDEEGSVERRFPVSGNQKPKGSFRRGFDVSSRLKPLNLSINVVLDKSGL